MQYEIISLTEDNLAKHPQAVCFTKKSDHAFQIKQDWLKKRFREGMRIKLLYPAGSHKAVGYIEYTPGEFAWRAVSATGYLFIHCLWISPNIYKNKGLASLLLADCYQDAIENDFAGVAVMCSGDSFLAKRDIFLKNGFQVADTYPAQNELLVKEIIPAKKPFFILKDSVELDKYRGFQIFYSDQCPWVIRLISEIRENGYEEKLPVKISKLSTPQEAQNSPSLYSVFALIYNGKILTDHYISMTRFRTILSKITGNNR